MNATAPKETLQLFRGLKKYSRADVEVLNRLADLFHAGADWAQWIQDGLGDLLEAPGLRQIMLEHSSQTEARPSVTERFQKDEITIGREPGNDVVLPAAGVGRRHARIFCQNGSYFIEDLRSANGTFLNDTKLKPQEPAALSDGARFVIFPEQFTFSSEQAWSGPQRLQIAGGTRRFSVWNPQQHGKTPAFRYFTIKISPDVGQATLGVSRELLKAVVYRISRANVSQLVPADDGVFEFVLLSVLERANRDLRFPFRFSLLPFEAPAKGDVGIAVETTIGLQGMTGALELFLPAHLLQEISRAQSVFRPLAVPVTWPLVVSHGYADLSLAEFAELEAGDILLLASEHQLLLPWGKNGRSERGWGATEILEQPGHLRIEDYFERSELMAEEQAQREGPRDTPGARPNLAALPVRVHVVLSQLEMTLEDLNKLTPGSIVDIGRDKEEVVHLAVNGKIAGTAELVEIDGRLGVRIASWAAQ